MNSDEFVMARAMEFLKQAVGTVGYSSWESAPASLRLELLSMFLEDLEEMSAAFESDPGDNGNHGKSGGGCS